MAELYLGMAAFLLLNLLVGLARIYRGPGRTDRLLAVQMFGTTSVAVLLLLAEVQALPALRDVALLFVLLGAMLSVAFVRLPPAAAKDEKP